jgi:hypothetical protein
VDESPQVTSESLRRDYDRLAALDESYYGSIARRVRVLIPWFVASIAIVASLGWSYTDYHARREWQRIAEEQTALAEQRAALANERAILLKQSEVARAQMIAREARLQERRRQVIDLTRNEIAEGKLTDAAIATWIVAEEVMIAEGKAAELADEYSQFMRSLLNRANHQPTDANDHGPR